MKTKRTKKNNINKRKAMEFEIRFYEKILEERPNFITCAKALAELYTKVGMYNKGLELDKRLSRILPADSTVYYNLACSYSLMGELDKSFEAILKAIELGFDDFSHMLGDPDLMNLKKNRRFEDILSKIMDSPK